MTARRVAPGAVALSVAPRAASTASTSASASTAATASGAASSSFKRHERIAAIKGKDGGVSRVGDVVQLRGWVRTVRAQKDLSFVEVNDGSSLSGIQAVVTADADGAALLADGHVTTGAAVVIEGVVVESPGGKQAVEVKADAIRVVGSADAATFPLQKKRHTLEFLRGKAARARSNRPLDDSLTHLKTDLSYQILEP